MFLDKERRKPRLDLVPSNQPPLPLPVFLPAKITEEAFQHKLEPRFLQ
jgi:hypothetical protein